MIEYATGPLSPEGQARLEKYGSTLTDSNVRRVIERIADYPEVVAAATDTLTEALLALHVPYFNDHDGHIPRDEYETCRHDHERYPCETVRIVREARGE